MNKTQPSPPPMQQDEHLMLAALNTMISEEIKASGSFCLTKAHLSELIFAQLGVNRSEAKQMVEAFFELIRTQLEQGDMVKLSGFGNFTLRDKVSRPGRNPKTGEMAVISARRVVTFQPSKKMREHIDAVNSTQEAAPAPTPAIQ